MFWRKWGYSGILAAMIIVFLFSSGKMLNDYLQNRQVNEQMEEARLRYKQTPQIKPLGAILPSVIHSTDPTKSTSSASLPLVAEPQDTQSSVLAAVYKQPRVIQDRFKPLLAMNSEIVGWIHIDDTVIDYPVVQAEDNRYYLTKDLDQKKNVNGSIFMDYRNQIAKPEKHWILYGHNMKNKSMFMSLLNYESKWYFEHHSYIEFDTLYDKQTWQVFSAYLTDESDDYIQTSFHTDSEYNGFLMDIRQRSLHTTNVTLSENDTILTLSTCSYVNEQARFVVHAKRISSSSH